MTIAILIDPGLWATARAHLDQRPEEVGFFLADWSSIECSFSVRAWRSIEDGRVGRGDDLHVSLSDEIRTSVIQWASAENACLIEAHSHGRWSPARFSSFDLDGLAEWVPHLWWRLQGRPYAALVTSTTDFDALAWVESPGAAEQVSGVKAGAFEPATRETLRERSQADE